MSQPTASPARRERRLALAVAVLFAVTSLVTLAAPAATLAWDTNTFSSSSESDLVALTNRARANAGLRSLRVDSTLRSVARWRSKDMIVRNYFSHTIPGYGKVWDKLHAVGYCYVVAGENIGWNNYPDDLATAAIQQAFMNSAGHRANIMGKTWDSIGIGAYKGPTGKKMWTVLFADKCGGTSTGPKATPKPRPRATPRPTPRPTPRATPRRTATPASTQTTVALTPAPTPLVDATPPISGDDLLPPETAGPDSTVVQPDGSEVPTTTDGTEPQSLRVVDRTSSDGLLGTIVGGVAGFFFGG